MPRNGPGTQTQEAPVSQSEAPDTQPRNSDVSLEEFLEGQRKINGMLCYVDHELVKAITELKNAVDRVLKIDLSLVNAALQRAYASSSDIPAVNPPGCVYPDPPRNPAT